MLRTIQLPYQRNLVSWASRAKDDFCTRVTEAVLYAGRRVGGTEGNCTRCDRSSKISSVRWDFRDDGLLPATAPAIQIPHCAATCWPPLGARRPTLRQRSWTIALAQFVQTLLLREDMKRQVLTMPELFSHLSRNAFLVHKRSPKTNVLNFELFLGCLYIFLPSSAFFAYIIFLWGF